MEVLFRNLPDQTTEKDFERFLRPLLPPAASDTFRCRKLKGRGLAIMTILQPEFGLAFLNAFGPFRNDSRLFLLGRQIHCSKSRFDPDDWLLKSMEKVRKESQKIKLWQDGARASPTSGTNSYRRKFHFQSLHCGLWDYDGDELVFVAHYQDLRPGIAIFRKQSLMLELHPSRHETGSLSHYITIPYVTVQAISMADQGNPFISLTLFEPPKMYEERKAEDQPNNSQLSSIMSKLSITGTAVDSNNGKTRQSTRIRVTKLGGTHQTIAGNCLVYRLSLTNIADLDNLSALTRSREIPPAIVWSTRVTYPKISFTRETNALTKALATRYGSFSFALKFQLQKLSQNNYLLPSKVLALLPHILRIRDRSGESVAAKVIKKLFSQLSFPGPETEARELALSHLVELLESNEIFFKKEVTSSEDHEDAQQGHDHIALVYKALITPTGTYLYGPNPEVKNRVLRKYNQATSYFVRVQFADENGESLRFDRQASNEEIFRSRFKPILSGKINIAGRAYEFLGFSHSSLRSQTCWFMAPFVYEENLLWARPVIENLGDFSKFRCPAKCAARIGQAFTDTYTSVTLPAKLMAKIDDVEHSGHVFSDGVGTMSKEVWLNICKLHSPQARPKPALFQIRYAGAKGMISYDSRLKGKTLCLRPSMIKFEGSLSTDIEICGAALKPLPMYLNRQLIKILEDLGVGGGVFEDLQAKAVESLRITTLSAVNAANYLQRNSIGRSAHIPWLLRTLQTLKISFQADEFLRDIVEMAVLMSLREMKYRSRIRVDQGVTLFGIMDETGFLEEGEIYCVVHSTESPRQVITGPVVITRSPALHPGDVRVVLAVDVPGDSPMNSLHNCVVFSQKGMRDLPSQLSGGDLDGDLYNVIYDIRLIPQSQHKPADYPRIPPEDIGRPVERDDMSEFFLQFMVNDQLGRIANLHQTLADQSKSGTRDPACLQLADMHSNAVVDMTCLPKHNHYKPDFMATGPRAEIMKGVRFQDIVKENNPFINEPEEDDEGGTRFIYYESEKVLGRLYRAIDERDFFEELQRQSRTIGQQTGLSAGTSVVKQVWAYVLKETKGFLWEHHLEWAKDIRETYEDNLIDTTYQFSTHPRQPLDELEVCVGSIIGKNSSQTHRQRDSSKDMRDKYDRDVEFTIKCITDNQDGEALERSVACMSLDAVGEKKGSGRSRSFGWLAATVCLRELERHRGAIWKFL